MSAPEPPPGWWWIEPLGVLVSLLVIGSGLALVIEVLRWLGVAVVEVLP